MSGPTIVISLLVVLGGAFFAAAPQISEALVRLRARRLPPAIARRMEEEWRGELHAIASRPAKLAFAIALVLTRRKAFVVPGEDSVAAIHDRPVGGFAMLGSWKSLLIVPTLVFAIAAYGASFLLPVRYKSTALMIVRPQDVSKDFIGNQSEEPLADRVDEIKQMTLSRKSMVELLIEFKSELNLADETMDRAVESLRKDVAVLAINGGNAFEVHYIGTDPKTAQKITNKLVSHAVESWIQRRFSRLDGTNDFLGSQLERLSQRLIDTRNQLERGRSVKDPGEADLLALDYKLLQSTYGSVFAKFEEVQTLLDMESKQRGEQLLVLDPANLGQPVPPNRMAIAGGGAFVGLALGGAAVIGLYRRQRRVLA